MSDDESQPRPEERLGDEEPDPKVLWRWVADAARPWIGWILVGVGAVMLLVGYLGVSREALPGKQIPYLVSGGIGGVFLAVIGAYVLGIQALRSDSGRLDRLERMVEELHEALLRRPDAPDLTRGNGAGDGTRATGPARRVVAVEDGDLFHRAGCQLVAGKDTEEMTPAAARRRGLEPCPACTPAPVPAR
jgi:hypothetical protein